MMGFTSFDPSHAPSADELEAHARFLSTIKDPIWNRLDGRG